MNVADLIVELLSIEDKELEVVFIDIHANLELDIDVVDIRKGKVVIY
jgi:hypothetical protein